MNKKKSIVIIGIITLTVVMIIGVTFALWQVTIKQESTNTITTGCFKVTFTDANPISLTNAFPITKEEGKSLTPYTFTITNTCDSYASYQINLEILNNTTFNDFDYFNTMLDDIVFSLKEKGTVPTTLSNATTAKKLETGYLDANQSKTFELRLWLDENTPATKEYMNQIFNSKVTIIATHQTEFDKESPTTNIEVTNLTNLIHVDASASGDNTNVKYYYYSLDGESFVKTKEPEYTFEVGELNYGVATDTIKTLADSLSEEYTVYVKTEDEYGNISDIVSSKKFYKDFAYDNTTDNNLRYIGSDPNNYVLFNDELWRIIGVMENIDDGTGKKETRIKLIRNESIGNYSWDTTAINVNSGYGTSEWSQSKIKSLLNEGPYWKRTTGTCYHGERNATVPCDFTSTGITEQAKQMISNAVWHTGSNGSMYNAQTIIADTFYSLERSNNNSKICSGGYCDDNITRKYKWTGKVGLMYPSDYGYATGGGETNDRNSCLATSLYNWQNKSDCYSYNYLEGEYLEYYWTMTPCADTKYGFSVFRIDRSKLLDHGHAYSYLGTKPVVYLNSSIIITSGHGTKESPFKLGL